MKTALLLATALLAAGAGEAWAAPAVKAVAAENFYGDVLRQIGGSHVAVTTILSNPNQDPHEFEASPSTARALAGAALVVYNGADYDPWMARLLTASPAPHRAAVVAADLVGARAGDNPHLWYDPKTMPAVAAAVAGDLERLDPADAAGYARRLATFQASLKPIRDRIAAIRAAHPGVAVTATEPVFGYMAAALGFAMRNERFQIAVMNDTEPSARDVAAFQNDLETRKVRLLFYNSQVTDEMTERLLKLAKASGVPVVGVTETAPAGKSYQQWMEDELAAVEHALAAPSR
ncbi:MAG TPA: zinc ABC transporter substrate-binding protein [Hyphomicrobiales bacterium]|nr:zinc ABC transporter substrate-binding protein [Hyphomicrobiales bacterium]